MQINMACVIVQAGCNIERGVLQSMPTKSDVVSGVTIMLEGGYTGHHFCVRLRQFWHYLGGRSVAYAIGPFYALDKHGMLVST